MSSGQGGEGGQGGRGGRGDGKQPRDRAPGDGEFMPGCGPESRKRKTAGDARDNAAGASGAGARADAAAAGERADAAAAGAQASERVLSYAELGAEQRKSNPRFARWCAQLIPELGGPRANPRSCSKNSGAALGPQDDHPYNTKRYGSASVKGFSVEWHLERKYINERIPSTQFSLLDLLQIIANYGPAAPEILEKLIGLQSVVFFSGMISNRIRQIFWHLSQEGNPVGAQATLVIGRQPGALRVNAIRAKLAVASNFVQLKVLIGVNHLKSSCLSKSCHPQDKRHLKQYEDDIIGGILQPLGHGKICFEEFKDRNFEPGSRYGIVHNGELESLSLAGVRFGSNTVHPDVPERGRFQAMTRYLTMWYLLVVLLKIDLSCCCLTIVDWAAFLVAIDKAEQRFGTSNRLQRVDVRYNLFKGTTGIPNRVGRENPEEVVMETIGNLMGILRAIEYFDVTRCDICKPWEWEEDWEGDQEPNSSFLTPWFDCLIYHAHIRELFLIDNHMQTRDFHALRTILEARVANPDVRNAPTLTIHVGGPDLPADAGEILGGIRGVVVIVWPNQQGETNDRFSLVPVDGNWFPNGERPLSRR